MLTQFRFESQEVRFVLIGAEVYFIAKDIARILGYANTSQAVDQHIDYEDKISDIELRKKAKELSQSNLQIDDRIIYTNESGVYALIFGSTKPEAKTFKRWLTKEVLPSIRKTGSYSVIAQPKKAITYYTDRVMDIDKNLKKPPNTWCVIEKCGHLLLKIERLGYQINKFDLLDGSVGRQWSSYRKDKEWALTVDKADYYLDSTRKSQEINAYQYPELTYFAPWLDNVYVKSKLPMYLNEKYGALVSS